MHFASSPSQNRAHAKIFTEAVSLIWAHLQAIPRVCHVLRCLCEVVPTFIPGSFKKIKQKSISLEHSIPVMTTANHSVFWQNKKTAPD